MEPPMTNTPSPAAIYPTLSVQPSTFNKKYNLQEHADLVLDRLSGLGYRAIEGGSSDPVEFKKKLDDRGMVYSGTHIAISAKPDLKPLVDYLKQVGGKHVINSGVLSWDKPGLDVFKESIVLLNQTGKALADDGIHLCYHNHAFEFDAIDGATTGMDVLINELDPRYCGLAIDVAWVWRGRQDPATFLRAHADMITYLHLKDTDDTHWKELGRGKLDWPSVMAEIAKLSRCAFAAVEQDQTYDTDPLESLTMSRSFLRDRFGY
jgi:sugar phosphate isomerase/epimerase